VTDRFPYIYRWRRPEGAPRIGQRCAVTARSRRGKHVHNFNSIRVVFEDGYVMITSGNAIRRAK
jgi:hypothetical protein